MPARPRLQQAEVLRRLETTQTARRLPAVDPAPSRIEPQTDSFEPESPSGLTGTAGLLRRGFDRRFSRIPAWVLVVELFIGLGWLRAVAAKVIDPQWRSGGEITAFLTAHEETRLVFYDSFIQSIVGPNVAVFAVVVVLLEAVAGVSLVLGQRRWVGLCVGMFLNLNFVLAGQVNPSIFYLISQVALMLWLVEFHTPRHRTTTALDWMGIGALGLAIFGLPHVTTLHPEHVIEDPGMTLVIFGGLVAFSTELTRKRLRD